MNIRWAILLALTQLAMPAIVDSSEVTSETNSLLPGTGRKEWTQDYSWWEALAGECVHKENLYTASKKGAETAVLLGYRMLVYRFRSLTPLVVTRSSVKDGAHVPNPGGCAIVVSSDSILQGLCDKASANFDPDGPEQPGYDMWNAMYFSNRGELIGMGYYITRSSDSGVFGLATNITSNISYLPFPKERPPKERNPDEIKSGGK